MAKGATAKSVITEKILETFSGSFKNGEKEIRIPFIEDGAELQIKVTLTCAKDNVPAPADIAKEVSGSIETSNFINSPEDFPVQMDTSSDKLTEEEKKRVSDLVERLGLA